MREVARRVAGPRLRQLAVVLVAAFGAGVVVATTAPSLPEGRIATPRLPQESLMFRLGRSTPV